ncbi:hypothetical protein EDE04_4292 [Streptomyces sp. 2132.2]|nr:hypothetical protein EDE04_4292 [Streptomyces sp. 2132.2]
MHACTLAEFHPGSYAARTAEPAAAEASARRLARRAA